MRKIRKALLASGIALGAAVGAAGPALAGTTFQVIVNGNAEVTRYPLTTGQKFTCGGTEYTVQTMQGSYGTYEITTTPRLTASVVCSA